MRVERHERAQVDDLGRRCRARPASRSAASSARGHHRRERDDRGVACPRARSRPRRAASTCSPSGTSPLIANSALCSQKMTGSGSRMAAASSPTHVGRGRRRDDLEAGDRHRPVLDALAVLRAEAQAGAVRGPEHERQRHLAVGHVAGLGDLVGDHVPGRPRRSRGTSARRSGAGRSSPRPSPRRRSPAR